MKEINTIFRGKIVGSNTGFHHHDWAYGNVVEELSTGKVFICDLSHFDSNTKLVDVMVEVEPETVGQVAAYIYGHSLFVDDIVIIHNYNGNYIGVVEHIKDGNERLGRFIITVKDVDYDSRDSYYIKVVGNIHDNPELLEETK